MIGCLYIAGTLFAIGTNSIAVPIGPNTVAVEYKTVVQLIANDGQTQVPKAGNESLAEWMVACDAAATQAVMESEQW